MLGDARVGPGVERLRLARSAPQLCAVRLSGTLVTVLGLVVEDWRRSIAWSTGVVAWY